MAAQGLLLLLGALAGVLVGTVHPALAVIFVPLGILSFVVPIFVSFAQMPMDGIMRAVIYFNQRIKKDGLDIEIKLYMLWQKRRALHGRYQGF